ncbi:cardiolipin synthase [Rhodopirellula sallentina]|uniref:Cardiolipin synthase n=1 Tax=Rhodopirellula sallentina SM41 TaxID=1263870 RepID=M5U7V5_9BACT|nr:cardiolipin synthase [Rhodopirellula sallentina]EMI53951.1 Cardiolipin synthetase 2 [Rhodopirellula sallentina SM41]
MFKRRKALSGSSDEPNTPAQPRSKRRRFWILFVVVMHILGALTSIQAVMSTRTSQGAVAWAVSLNTLPYVAVPAYWGLGQSKFDGYDLLRRSEHLANSEMAIRTRRELEEDNLLLVPQSGFEESESRLLNKLTQLPITTGNTAKLLIDGQATFDAILDNIDQAKSYVLFQFYILRDDELGQRCKEAFLKKAAQGVQVLVLYDELGSKDLSAEYINELRDGGVEIYPFNTTQGKGNRFRLNFRNHRKIVVIDGEVAFVGGHNVGDEYLGKHPTLTPWRDTHVELRGPVVLCVQTPFAEDWNWATGSLPDLNWEPKREEGGEVVAACLPTGPADTLETGTLFFLHAINSAKDRLWIVSPYFIPDEQLMSALQLAALRGVDVRILIPQNPDHLHVYLSGISYLEEAKEAGIEIYRYQPGFLHQKVWLIDDSVSLIGTANLDNRSMRLNFEVSMLMIDRVFASEVETMLEADFAKSQLATVAEYTERSLPFRFLVRVCRLLAPVQ